MDELRAAYRRANHEDARSLAELLDFDPLPDDTQRQSLRREYDAHRKLFDDAYAACRANPASHLFAILRGNSNVFWSFVKSQHADPLRVFQLLRFWRLDRVTGPPSAADEIAYVQIAAGLLHCAAHRGYRIDTRLRQPYAAGAPRPRTVYAAGALRKESLPEPEVEAFVLAPLRARHVHYASSYQALFEQFFANVSAFLDQCDLFLRLRIFGSRTFHTAFALVSEEEFVEVVRLLVSTPKAELAKRSFPIERAPGRWEHATGSRQIGEWIGTKLRIVYFEGPHPREVYVEHVAAPGLVFKVPIGVVKGFADDAAFDLVFEFNKHLLILIPAFFELLMYIPGIVERGVFGLVQMLIDPVVGKAAGEVLDEFGFDPNLAGFWVGGLALLTHWIKPRLGKQPVRGPEELGTADSRAFGALPANPRGTGAGAAAVQTRGLGGDLAGAQARGLPGDLARAEPRGHAAAPAATSAEARVSEIVEPKGMTKAGGAGRQFDAPWLDRAATPPAAGQRAAEGGTQATHTEVAASRRGAINGKGTDVAEREGPAAVSSRAEPTIPRSKPPGNDNGPIRGTAVPASDNRLVEPSLAELEKHAATAGQAQQVATEIAQHYRIVEEVNQQAVMAARKVGSASPGLDRIPVTTRATTVASRGVAARGTGGPLGGAAPRAGSQAVGRTVLEPALAARKGIDSTMKKWIEDVAAEWRKQCARFKKMPGLSAQERGRRAHAATQRAIKRQHPGTIDEELTGVHSSRTSRMSDLEQAPHTGAVAELKPWAWRMPNERLATSREAIDSGVETLQIQAYGILDRDIGRPVFVFTGNGDVWTPKPGGGWDLIGELSD